MSKLALALVAVSVSGCASMGEWRTLSIDGSSESAFGESLSLLNEELPYARRQMLALALVDIAQTELPNADSASDGSEPALYENLRSRLDGMSYEGVIALADRTGPPIRTIYYSRGWGEAQADANRLLTAGDRPLGPPPGIPSRDPFLDSRLSQ